MLYLPYERNNIQHNHTNYFYSNCSYLFNQLNKLNNMKNTARELENMANAILATLEYKEKQINEYVKPAYFVKISESGLSARFEAHYTNEDDKDDKTPGFTLLEKDSMTKLISYIEDDYYNLVQIQPN